MFEDLRGFLAHLDRQGQLLHVKDEVDVKYEIAAGMRKTSDIEGPALLFENIRGYRGWRVLGGLFATRKLVALGLGVPQEQMLERYLTLEDQRIPPEPVSTGPVKEIKWTGSQIDLTKIPIVTHASKDCGPYVTIGVQIGKDPDSGVRNLSIHRMLVLGRDRLSLWAPADHHLGRMILKAEEKGRGLEVATAVGVDPAVIVASQAKVPYGIDEFYVAGGLRGGAVKLVKCETIDVEVPAFAEVVIEGVTIPGERVADGPYGEYPGCYSEAKQAPVLKVTAITMRQNPIWPVSSVRRMKIMSPRSGACRLSLKRLGIGRRRGAASPSAWVRTRRAAMYWSERLCSSRTLPTRCRRQTLACHKPLRLSMVFCMPCSSGGTNTGITSSAKHRRLMRPTALGN